MKKILVTLAFSLFASLASQTFAQGAAKIKITGNVQKPIELSVEDLAALNKSSFEGVDVYCQSGELKDQADQLTGVPLKIVLQQAGIKVSHPKDFRKIAIIAKAPDDYWVTFSYGEIFNQPAATPVLVYFAKNQQPLSKDEGPIAVMPMSDERMGGRQVKWLTEIEVRLLPQN